MFRKKSLWFHVDSTVSQEITSVDYYSVETKASKRLTISHKKTFFSRNYKKDNGFYSSFKHKKKLSIDLKKQLLSLFCQKPVFSNFSGGKFCLHSWKICCIFVVRFFLCPFGLSRSTKQVILVSNPTFPSKGLPVISFYT